MQKPAVETSVQVPDGLVPSPFLTIRNFFSVQTPGQVSQSFSVGLGSRLHPVLFAANASGAGPLAAMNQDGSINTATNAAAGGTTVTMYATGEGYTVPPGVDGAIQEPGISGPRSCQ